MVAILRRANDAGATATIHRSTRPGGEFRMADWDVIAKQRLTEDWGTLRAAYLPLNQGMRRTIEFLDKGGGKFDELLPGGRERGEGRVHHPPTPAGGPRPAGRGGGGWGRPAPCASCPPGCAARPRTPRARSCATSSP